MARKHSHRPILEALEDRLLPSGVPALSSLPGAPATLYLDFDGHFEASWGSYNNVQTPAYDIDGDPASFSAAELVNIQRIWRAVAEDYAPFNLNVTTVEPPAFDNGVALCAAIGGNSSWAGATMGGISFVNSFTNSLANTVYVFSDTLGGDPRAVADAASHEAGHAFGLAHQRLWDGTTKIEEYQTGPGDGTAPLLGDSYAAARSLWWYGTTSSATTFQNDMQVIAGSVNGFGYRLDDHGNSVATATTPIVSASGTFTAGGVIEQMSDLDYFRFSSPGGAFTFSVTVGENSNLDPRLELRDADGNFLAAANPAGSYNVSITYILPAGEYFLVVASGGVSSGASAGNFGFNVGQYTVSSVVADPAAAASSLPWINTRNNTTFSTAKKLVLAAGASNFITDLNTVANVDYYKFKLPADSDGTLTVTMNSRGLGSLIPKLAVYNSAMKRLARIGGGAGSAVTLNLSGLKPGKVFYIMADGPKGAAFGKGDYRLSVHAGQWDAPMGTAFTASSSALAAAAAISSSTPHGHDDGSSGAVGDGGTRDSSRRTIVRRLNDLFHFQLAINRYTETSRNARHELLHLRATHGGGRRRGSARNEARLLAKAGLLQESIDYSGAAGAQMNLVLDNLSPKL